MILLASPPPPATDLHYPLRRIIKAMSEPGVIVTLPQQQAWGSLSPAATTLLLALLDGSTPLWLDDTLNDAAVRAGLQFHTGVPLTTGDDALFALLHADTEIDLGRFSTGRDFPAARRVTAIVETPALRGGLTLRLRGPGIGEARAIAPQLSEHMLHYLCEGPRDANIILACGETLLALPHDIQVETY